MSSRQLRNAVHPPCASVHELLCCCREVVAVGLDDLPDSVLQQIAQQVTCFLQRCAPLYSVDSHTKFSCVTRGLA